ncbi:MAG TPA: carbohydrate ABC transporter permease [Halanaerobiales bacterium]|jgi:ABC-type glycerol-3-phosphate transport system permease component|nr:carbohydrate ABC transporter permease [Halanaerobiales bacterium]HPZ63548.1 carbohydrate ABC transporter permease [Halanaerobiales bacterium]HQD04362.1 carbohydrate ABC transporter permease [Halanaerobiales bacterium]
MMKIDFSIRRMKISRSAGGDALLLFILIVTGLFMAIPLVYTVTGAFKPMNEIFLYPPRIFVRNPTLDNFKDLFILMGETWIPITRYFMNSILIVILGTGGHVIISSMGAYVVSKHTFPGKRFFSEMVILSLMFAAEVTAIPNFLIMSKLGWINTLTSMIVPAWGYSLGFYLMSRFMTQIPDTLLEAAKIDGASEFRIFWTIVMPSVKPAWLTLMILSFQQLWRDQGGRFIYKEVLKPLPYALSQMAAGGLARQGVAAVVALIMMLVPIILFVFNQSQIVETMSTSGID